MSGTGGGDEEATIEDLVKRLQVLVENYNDLVEALEYLPAVHEVRLIETIAKLIDFFVKTSADTRMALWEYVNCNADPLVDLSVEQHRQLLEMLRAVVRLELELVEDEGHEAGLEAFLEEIEKTLEDWNDEIPREQATEILEGLKDFILEHYPEVLSVLAGFFGDEFREALEKWAEKRSPALAKLAIWLFINTVVRHFKGKAVAARLSGILSIATSVAQLIAIGYIVPQLEHVEDLIAEVRAELVRRLAEKGMRWLDHFAFVWVADPETYEGTTVEIRPYVRCATEEDGELVWSDPCPVRFADGSGEKSVELDRDSPDDGPAPFDEEEGRWEIPYGIDAERVEETSCIEGAEMCYLVLEVTVTVDGERKSGNYIVGVKVF